MRWTSDQTAARIASAIRKAGPGRPVLADDVWDFAFRRGVTMSSEDVAHIVEVAQPEGTEV